MEYFKNDLTHWITPCSLLSSYSHQVLCSHKKSLSEFLRSEDWITIMGVLCRMQSKVPGMRTVHSHKEGLLPRGRADYPPGLTVWLCLLLTLNQTFSSLRNVSSGPQTRPHIKSGPRGQTSIKEHKTWQWASSYNTKNRTIWLFCILTFRCQ